MVIGWEFEVLWLVPIDKFAEVNFSKLTDSYQIFRNDFVCIHCDLCKISPQIIEYKIFGSVWTVYIYSIV